MRSFLLDTSVLSLLAPGRACVASELSEWLHAHGNELFISTITIVEIRQGICKLQRTGSVQQAERLGDWLGEVIETRSDRILPFDIAAAEMAGRIADFALSKGRHPGFPDVAIAAIATSRDMTLLTLNGRHFEPLEISYADPSAAGFLDA